MTKEREALKLALEWYDSGNEDRNEFQIMIESILAQPQQELVHSVQSNGKHSPLLTHMMNKRTTPPKRQPLTLNEMSAIEEKVYMQTIHKGKPSFEYAHALIRATEAAHGIKENT